MGHFCASFARKRWGPVGKARERACSRTGASDLLDSTVGTGSDGAIPDAWMELPQRSMRGSSVQAFGGPVLP